MRRLTVVLLAALSWACSRCEERCVLAGRKFEPSYLEHGVITVGQVHVPTTTRHPDRWYLIWRDSRGNEHTVEVNQAQYDEPPSSETLTVYHWTCAP